MGFGELLCFAVCFTLMARSKGLATLKSSRGLGKDQRLAGLIVTEVLRRITGKPSHSPTDVVITFGDVFG